MQALYAKGPAVWRKYLYYFSWAKYQPGSVFLNADLKPVQGGHEASFVARQDGAAWPDYAYFDQRWSPQAMPLNYDVSRRPNAYGVGIEILSVGAKKHSPTAYTEKMYVSLRRLVTDICARQQIPMVKGRVIGHEDVNPVQRYGWDPGQGFDWTRVWQ